MLDDTGSWHLNNPTYAATERALVSGLTGIFFIPYERYTLAGVLGVLFSVCLVLFFCLPVIDNKYVIPLDR